MTLTAKDVCVNIKENQIIKNVNAEVRKGEFIGIVGPNGSGKSTFLKSIYRVIKPQCGLINLDGKDIRKISYKETAKKMAVVGQFNEFNFDFNVEEIVMMGRTPHKKSFDGDNIEDYEIMESCLKKVNMEGYKNRKFSTLSGGERQRVLLARALAQQPKILILDEPTNHLDIKYQLQLLNIIESLKLQVFAALHDLNLASRYCDRIYVMNKGTVVAEGKPKEILTSKLIKDVFEVEAEIFEHPVTGRMNIMYL
ncbi:ABC transporter ATP-binding protein [Haloimpatiens massiliensis]|uniref:ABC transporter ATP-binding protein n=1 Tax=Haloimpatiens massiliensis TaxID=1658110 RepID=UPI000C837995|nr:ABC transporter ATP-binding protein [Haloimpatiens massiliensis]